jgi:hypothetical protein
MDPAACNRQLKIYVIFWMKNINGNTQSGDLGEEKRDFIFKMEWGLDSSDSRYFQ